MRAFIVGSGSYVPETMVSNESIAQSLGLNADEIFRSSGIRSRRWAAAGTKTSDLAVNALRAALQDADSSPEQIDYLIFGTMTPDRFIPGTSFSVQRALGLRAVPCLDIRAACCNMLYALQLAGALISADEATTVAICLAEIQSPWLDLSSESGTTSMLFGDGASALIVSKDSRVGALRFVGVELASNGSYVDDLGIRCPGTEFGSERAHPSAKYHADYSARMIGQTVIVQALRRTLAVCEDLLKRNSLTIDDVRWLVPHQANQNILDRLAKGLQFRNPEGMISIVGELGNTSSASMGIALDELRRSNLISSGDYIILPAFAAGFTWGGGLCQAV